VRLNYWYTADYVETLGVESDGLIWTNEHIEGEIIRLTARVPPAPLIA
jgi:hypothetical protein